MYAVLVVIIGLFFFADSLMASVAGSDFPLLYEKAGLENCEVDVDLEGLSKKSKNDLALCYILGDDDSMVDRGIEILFSITGEDPDPFALYNLGMLYLEKDGFKDSSLKFLLFSAKCGVVEAKHLVSTLMLQGDYDQIVTNNLNGLLYEFSSLNIS